MKSLTRDNMFQVMAWCCQTTSHYLKQCWTRYLSAFGVTRPHKLGNLLRPGDTIWVGHHYTTKFLYSPHNEVVIPPGTQRSCWGVYWFHSVHPFVRPSIRPASRVRSVAPTFLVGSTSYLYILSNNFRRCITCKVTCKIAKFEFLAIFLNL